MKEEKYMSNRRNKFDSICYTKKHGFTLAEVLITLVIIGIITAIAIPTLIAEFQKEQTVVRLKKAFSALSQASWKSIADNGPINTWEYPELSNGQGANYNDAKKFLNKYIVPYISIMKGPMTLTSNNRNAKFLNGSDFSYSSDWPIFYFPDGTSVVNRLYRATTGGIYLYVYIDTNGDKKPNKLGRDVFLFDFPLDSENPRFQPHGRGNSREHLVSTSSYQCNKHASGGGETCAALIMKDGWQIKSDYPW